VKPRAKIAAAPFKDDPTLEQKIALKGVAAGTAKVDFNRR
jgi:hypothetical protein